jgi:hypothetical protein
MQTSLRERAVPAAEDFDGRLDVRRNHETWRACGFCASSPGAPRFQSSHEGSVRDARDREGHAGPKQRGETLTQPQIVRDDASRWAPGGHFLQIRATFELRAPGSKIVPHSAFRSPHFREARPASPASPRTGHVGCHALSVTKRADAVTRRWEFRPRDLPYGPADAAQRQTGRKGRKSSAVARGSSPRHEVMRAGSPVTGAITPGAHPETVQISALASCASSRRITPRSVAVA